MDLSTLSFVDMVKIISHFNSLYSDKKLITDDELLARGYNKSAIEQFRKQRTETFGSFESCGLRFKSDFSKTKYELYNYVEQLYELYTKGTLPFPGSVSEQPGQIMEIFRLLDSLNVEKYNRETKKRNSKRK